MLRNVSIETVDTTARNVNIDSVYARIKKVDICTTYTTDRDKSSLH